MINKFNIFFLLILLTLISSCTNFNPIEAEYFIKEYKAKKGDDINVKWKFKNAVSVSLKQFPDKTFKAEDSVKYICKNDTLIFSAENIKYKYVDTSWITEITSGFTGDEKAVDESFNFKSSLIESNYMLGISDIEFENSKLQIKVTKQYLDAIGSKHIRFVILDEFGNFIPNYFKSKKEEKLILKNHLDFGILAQTIENYKINEVSKRFDDQNHIGILLEKSVSMDNLSEVRDEISDFISFAYPNDLVSISRFNQSNEALIIEKKYDAAIGEFEHLPDFENSGLSAIYRSLFEYLNKLKTGTKPNQMSSVVAILNSNDNCSIDVEISDVIDEALKYKIPINVVLLNQSSESFLLKILAESTGGKFYNLNNEIATLDQVLSEIYLSQNYYYDIEVEDAEVKKNLDKYLFSELKFEMSKTSPKSDKFDLFVKNNKFEVPYKILSIFDENSSMIEDRFDILYHQLADLLKDNPDFKIELIGHDDTKEKTANAQKRAQNARKKLIELGANSSQILVNNTKSKELYDSKPIFYLPKENWQHNMNRRVEVRWLDPDLFPFEIITQKLWTENEAEQNVESWENRGFKAYYERNISDNFPIYYVKLWGYKTIEDAKLVTKEISSKYKVKAEVR